MKYLLVLVYFLSFQLVHGQSGIENGDRKRGVIPDIEMKITTIDLMGNSDSQLDEVYQLIKRQN